MTGRVRCGVHSGLLELVAAGYASAQTQSLVLITICGVRRLA